MTGFYSFNKFKTEIKDLTQIYDFTLHLYSNEHTKIHELITSGENKKETLTTSVGTIEHSLNSLLQYTKENYPKKLRQLILINSVTAMEVFLTDMVQEISGRSLGDFKTDDKVEYSRGQLLNFSSIQSIENDLLQKDIRKLTSGGLHEAKKYFLSKFNIDFTQDQMKFSDVQEIHDRRHLQVHRNGKCDAQYALKYSQFGFKPSQTIFIEHEYIISALKSLELFGKKITEAALEKYPDSTRSPKSVKGSKTTLMGEIKLMIEIQSRIADFDISELNGKRIKKSTEKVSDFILQYTKTEKRYKIFVSASPERIRDIMYLIKREEKIEIIQITQIMF